MDGDLHRRLTAAHHALWQARFANNQAGIDACMTRIDHLLDQLLATTAETTV